MVPICLTPGPTLMDGSAWCARITLEDAPLRPLDKYRVADL